MSTIASTEKASVLVILRREYLDITGNFCAAKLIEYFRHWTKWKLKNHRTPWVYQPLKRIYADLMGEHSLHVIRAAIALLEGMGIVKKQKNPGNGQDRTYQYKLNFDVLNQLLESGKCETEPPKFNGESSDLRSDPETSYPQQHTAAVEKSDDEVSWEAVAKMTEVWEQQQSTHLSPQPEQPQSPHCADQPEEVNSSDEIDPHKVQFSAPENEVISNLDQPTKQQIAEVCNELRRLRINPTVECLGVIKKYWSNVQGAIGYLKEALQTWKEVKSPTGVFITACKEGKKPKNAVTKDVKQWFDWAYKKRIVAGMAGGSMVYTHDGVPVPLDDMMRQYPMPES